MQKTLEACQRHRPRGYWGFYGFPNCYNYEQGQNTCSSRTKDLNDEYVCFSSGYLSVHKITDTTLNKKENYV